MYILIIINVIISIISIIIIIYISHTAYIYIYIYHSIICNTLNGVYDGSIYRWTGEQTKTTSNLFAWVWV